MWIKICGTTNLGDAELAAELGADALGFIFAPSKRRVTVEEAAAITANLPQELEKVGVFTDASKGEIITAVQTASLTAVQLHMHHDPLLTHCLRALLGSHVHLIQVVPFYTGDPDEDIIRESFQKPLTAALADPALWAVLLDTAKAGRSGGLGEAFSWRLALPAVRAAQTAALYLRAAHSQTSQLQTSEPGASIEDNPSALLPELLVAGGLDAGNVEEAIAVLQPSGVDVVSGVEAVPGRKDRARLAAFIQAARSAGANRSS